LLAETIAQPGGFEDGANSKEVQAMSSGTREIGSYSNEREGY